ncbi:MAG: MFS transporter, partial [Pseudomonadota bacterium]
LDRIGKGVRGTPRDALLAASVPAERLGRAFGFHRAMDYLGSGLGPAIGALALAFGVSIRGLFALAVIPSVFVLAMIAFGVQNERLASPNAAKRPLPWRDLPGRLRGLLIASALLAVTSVHDAFLVLWINDRLDGSVRDVLLLFAVVNIVRAVVAMFGGELTDRIGTLPTIIIGWLSRIALLVFMASAPSVLDAGQASALVVALTATMAWSGPAELTLLTRAAPEGNRGAVLGTYHMLTGLLMLPGVAAFGLLWQQLGANTALLAAATGTGLAAATLILLSFTPSRSSDE